MLTRRSSHLLAFLLLISLASCVSSKKYKAATAEQARLSGQVDSLNNRVNDLNSQVSTLTSQNAELDKKVKECVVTVDDIRKQKERFDQALAEQGTSMEEIRTKLQDAVSKFEAQGMTVTNKDGMVVVSMEDRLVFKPGSTAMGKNGRDALGVVAEVINQSPNVKVYVVGNADASEKKKGRDVWTLSTERANAVVRSLEKNYNVDPARLTSAGRGSYSPVADNETSEGKARNRRTEIIFNPDFSKLWELKEGTH